MLSVRELGEGGHKQVPLAPSPTSSPPTWPQAVGVVGSPEQPC